MREMTPEERRAFLLDSPHTGKLASVKKDGSPHVTPIWYDLDGETIVFTTWHTSVKTANIRRDGRVSMCVDEEAPPFAYVIVEGQAELIEQAEDLLYWATRIATRYMGAAQGEAFGKRNAVPGEHLVRIHPTKWIAVTNISD